MEPMLRAAISGLSSRMWAIRSSLGMPTAPVEKLTITSVRARTSSKMARKVSTLQSGPPSSVRAWMWTMAAPASAARRASSPISAGVYGIAGQSSRRARTPVRAALTRHLSVIGAPARSPDLMGISYRHVGVLAPGGVDALALGLDQALMDHPPGLGGVDHVVDHGPAGRDVGADRLPHLLDQPLARGVGVVRLLDDLVENDVDRPLGPHHRD